MAVDNNYPKEHLFLLRANSKSDFFTESKRLFSIEKVEKAEIIAEEISKLDDSYREISGYCIIDKIDENYNYQLNSRFLSRYRALESYLNTNVTAESFERLCAYYLQMVGCEQVQVTRKSDDQGLDFYGRLPLQVKEHYRTQMTNHYLVGQAKLYTNKVSTMEIREFIGSVEMLKRRISSNDNYVYELSSSINMFTSLTPIFIASSSFTSEAAELCRRVSIKCVNIVVFLSMLTSDNHIFDSSNQLLSSKLEQHIAKISLAPQGKK
ncbi:restriction endonuclease [Vibrio fluvialis]|nr:restriction endonuclease [Vibrio fluvialis]